ncbi:MAG: TadE/TadG family type IV pilus assembly protein [Bacteroidota bacterium]
MEKHDSRTGQRGAAAVELAILLIPLVLLAFGITEYGRAMYQYNALAKGVRSAVRQLSEYSAGDATQIGIAKCLAVYGNYTCSGAPVAPGLTTAMVSVCDTTNCAGTHLNQSTGSGVVNLVTVTISDYPFISLVPSLVPNLTFGDISATMRQVT